MDLIKKSCDIVGGQSRLAEELGVTPGFVYQLVKGIKPLPARLALPIERATGGAVTRYELRPDIYPPDDHPTPQLQASEGTKKDD
jgi:DNA-binding transcriptional regulator YdaS (Cro superfamily)